MLPHYYYRPLSHSSNHLPVTRSRMLTRFFFSSRRRHTRLQGDWSSDVCSSDLRGSTTGSALSGASLGKASSSGDRSRRSEERRVGKECRARLARYHGTHETTQSAVATINVAARGAVRLIMRHG